MSAGVGEGRVECNIITAHTFSTIKIPEDVLTKVDKSIT